MPNVSLRSPRTRKAQIPARTIATGRLCGRKNDLYFTQTTRQSRESVAP